MLQVLQQYETCIFTSIFPFALGTWFGIFIWRVDGLASIFLKVSFLNFDGLANNWVCLQSIFVGLPLLFDMVFQWKLYGKYNVYIPQYDIFLLFLKWRIDARFLWVACDVWSVVVVSESHLMIYSCLYQLPCINTT